MFFFSKMQATGNDFIVLNNLENRINYSYKLLSKFLCMNHFVVGADGVIIIENSKIADCKMRIFNKDGSEAEMCGNGIRCLAKYVYEKGIIIKNIIKVETIAGIKEVFLKIDNKKVATLKVNMGKIIWDFDKIPVFRTIRNDANVVVIEGLKIYPVLIGNPHAVCFVDNLKEFDVQKYGKIIENHKYFPQKTNVEFVKIENKSKLLIRIWERGVGETNSCGTGVCAAAAVSSKYKSTKNELIVETQGGNLSVCIGDCIELSGGAEFVFEGQMNI